MKVSRAATEYRVYSQIRELMKEMETGSEDPNKVADIIGADPSKED